MNIPEEQNSKIRVTVAKNTLCGALLITAPTCNFCGLALKCVT